MPVEVSTISYMQRCELNHPRSPQLPSYTGVSVLINKNTSECDEKGRKTRTAGLLQLIITPTGDIYTCTLTHACAVRGHTLYTLMYIYNSHIHLQLYTHRHQLKNVFLLLEHINKVYITITIQNDFINKEHIGRFRWTWRVRMFKKCSFRDKLCLKGCAFSMKYPRIDGCMQMTHLAHRLRCCPRLWASILGLDLLTRQGHHEVARNDTWLSVVHLSPDSQAVLNEFNWREPIIWEFKGSW